MWVYVVENKLNGKLYVGQTVQQDPSRRWGSHRGAKSGAGRAALKAAIQKYGEGNFSFSVIDAASSPEELDGKEIYWIHHLNSLAPGGYNLTDGGCSNHRFSDEARSRMKASAIARAEREGSRRTPETARQKEERLRAVRKAQSERMKGVAPFAGQRHSDETKALISKKKKGQRCHTSPVLRSDGARYDTVKEAAVATGCNRISVLKVLSGSRRAVYGYTFSYVEKEV